MSAQKTERGRGAHRQPPKDIEEEEVKSSAQKGSTDETYSTPQSVEADDALPDQSLNDEDS